MAVFSGLAAQEQEARWQEFRSEQGRFRVLVPGPMKEKQDTVDTFVGAVVYHTFFFQPFGQSGENLLYLLSYCDYPEHTVHSDSTDLLAEFFAITMSAAAESVDGEISYSDDIRLKRYPGKLWRVEYLDGKAIIKSRAYLVGRRFYSLQAVMFREKILNLSSERFLESFRVFR